MTIRIEVDVLDDAVNDLRSAVCALDAAASSAPASIDGGAATSLVAAWVAELCESAVAGLTATDSLCGATDAAAAELITTNQEAAAAVAFLEGSL